jgi:quercetin dioxygenase-like cupin family protein
VFAERADDGYTEPAPGVRLRPLVCGASTLMAEFRLASGHVLPAHVHPHEQTGYLVSGRIRLRIGGEAREMRPGDSWCVPGGVEHLAEILEDSVAVEVWSPVREDLVSSVRRTTPG